MPRADYFGLKRMPRYAFTPEIPRELSTNLVCSTGPHKIHYVSAEPRLALFLTYVQEKHVQTSRIGPLDACLLIMLKNRGTHPCTPKVDMCGDRTAGGRRHTISASASGSNSPKFLEGALFAVTFRLTFMIFSPMALA